MGSEAPLKLDSVLPKHIHGWSQAFGGSPSPSYSTTINQTIGSPKEIIRCSAATTGNVTLSGTQVVDGLNLPDGSLVLVWLQSSPAENAIYRTSSTAWTRVYSVDQIVQYIIQVVGGTHYANRLFTTIDGTTFKLVLVLDDLNAHRLELAGPVDAGHVKVDGTTIAISGTGLISTPANRTVQQIRFANNHTYVSSRHELDFVAGSGISMSFLDNGASDRLEVTISTTSSGPTGSGTANRLAMWSGASALADSPIEYNAIEAKIKLPWVAGDGKDTLFVGSTANTNTRTAVVAYSGTGKALYGEVNYGGQAIYGYNGVNGCYGYLGGVANGVYGEASSGSYYGVKGLNNTGYAVVGQTDSGTAVYGEAAGTGVAVLGHSTTGAAIFGLASSSGIGVKGNSSSGQAGYFSNNSGTNAAATLQADNNAGSGPAIYAYQSGSGQAAKIQISNTLSTADALLITSDATNCVKINFTGSGSSSTTANNLIVGQAGGTNRFRVDKTGKVYANGGSVSSGADFAEMVAVEGSVSGYQPGDIVVFSTSSDRTVKKSSGPSASQIAGVVSTFPGFIATKENIDSTALALMVAVAMIGIVPIKVCNEGGAIARGDLLVTSSIPGVAKKAGASPDPQTIVGRAWQPFTGTTGIIEARIPA